MAADRAAGGSAPGGLTLDDALVKHIGEFGRAQIRTLLVVSLFWVTNGLLILCMVFHVSPSPVKEHWWRCTDASDADCERVFGLTDPTRELCDLPRSSWEWTQRSYSIISQFDLVCGRSFMSQLANSGFFMGYLIGSGVFGGLADTRGRKIVLFGCTALGALFTFATGLAPAYPAYFIFRLVTGIGAAGQALTTYILATESVGPSWRGFAGVATQLFFIVGEFLLVLLAYLMRPWRVLSFACAACNAALLLLWPLIAESPRWLLVQGRRAEATAILARIAAANGRAMPSEPIGDAGGNDVAVAATASAAAASATSAEEGSGLLAGQAPHEASHHHSHHSHAGHQHQHHQQRLSGSGAGALAAAGAAAPAAAPSPGGKAVTLTSMLLRDRHMLRRFLVLAYVWFAVCLIYYGISLGVGGLPGSLYVTFMITSAMEFPSNVLAAWMIERYGRHNTMAAGMLLAGAACLACAFVPAGMASAALAAIGKFGCAGAFTIASIFTSEMFPTLVRSAVLGAENEAARVGGISAPFIVLVGSTTGQAAMPFIIFGVASLVAGVAIFTLPETLGTKLPDTMADMGGIQSIFTTQPWRNGGWRAALREMFRSRGGPARAGTGSPPGGGTPTKDTAAAPQRSSHMQVQLHAAAGGAAGAAARGLRASHDGSEDLAVEVLARVPYSSSGGGGGDGGYHGGGEHHAGGLHREHTLPNRSYHHQPLHAAAHGGGGGGGGGPERRSMSSPLEQHGGVWSTAPPRQGHGHGGGGHVGYGAGI